MVYNLIAAVYCYPPLELHGIAAATYPSPKACDYLISPNQTLMSYTAKADTRLNSHVI